MTRQTDSAERNSTPGSTRIKHASIVFVTIHDEVSDGDPSPRYPAVFIIKRAD